MQAFATFRDHFASIFQSAVTELGRRTSAAGSVRRTRSLVSVREDELASIAAELLIHRRDGTPGVPSGRTRSLDIPGSTRRCAALALRYMEAKLSGEPARIAEVEGEFAVGSCDPAWATTITEYLKFFGPGGRRREIPYIDPAQAGESVIPIKSGSRIALLADWGTGAQPSLEILQQIHKLSPDLLIHLGDVYYSGTPGEYKRAFMDPISEILGPDRLSLPVFALSGNHDMYCGGVGYYDAISKLNPKPFRQLASYFCLRSEDDAWQLLAMDTGLNDYSPLSVADCITHVNKNEVDWLLRRVAEFSGKTILLSHHQLFSAFSSIGKAATGIATNPHLLSFFSEAVSLGKIPAWFWGHEHSLCIYEPYAGLERGRCIGHGAVPVLSDEKIYSPVDGLERPPRIKTGTQLGLNGSVFAHGFTILTLGGRTATTQADYYQSRGGRAELLFSEGIS